ncbi:hypothetical protein GA0115252_17805 [Streptomyces sp. DfronAA-171]|nr:hypothetical protein GA0115252_17805 [Streptomyces sp. DfronAA-171]
MPPTGTKLPSSTAFLIRAYTSGRRSFIHAYCCAEEQAKTSSGYSSASAVTFVNVRAHLRTVSRSGHSHAESMCACPTACTVCAEACAGRARTSARTSRPRAAVAAASHGSTTSTTLSSARRISHRRGADSGSWRMSSSRTLMSWSRCHTSSSRTARSATSSRYRGSSPAVRRELYRIPIAALPAILGFAASSTRRSISSPPVAGSARRTVRW